MIEFPDIRREYGELSARSARFALTSLLVFAIGSLSFARAVRHAETGHVKTTVKQIYAVKANDEDPDISWLAWLVTFNTDLVTSPERHRVPAADWKGPSTQEALEARLREEMSELFTIEPTLLGTRLRIDLLAWFPFLPLVALGSVLYMSILRSKMEVLRRIAIGRANGANDLSTLDRLTFGSLGRRSTYAAYPSRLAFILFAVGVIFLTSNVIVALANVADPILATFLNDYLRLPVLALVYTLVLCQMIRQRLLDEAALLTDVAGPATVWFRMVSSVRERARARWRRYISVGSVMTLLSLFMTTALTKQCDPRDGIALARGEPDVVWPVVAYNMAKGYKLEAIGRIMYMAGVALALVCLLASVLALIPAIRRVMRRQLLILGALRIAAVVGFFFVISEFGFVFARVLAILAYYPHPHEWQLVYWVFPSALFVWFGVIRRYRYATAWEQRIRPWIWCLYAPALITLPITLIDIVLLSSPGWLIGTTFYVAGASLMAAGLTNLPRVRSQTD